MNINTLTHTARLALASAYLLAIPTYLTIFPPRFGLSAYVVYCGGYALLALAAAVSLIWFGRYTPYACILLPVLNAMESFRTVFSIPESMPPWYPARALMFPLIWIAIAVFLYFLLRAAVANKMNVQQSVAGPAPQSVPLPEP